ncbi:RNA-binding S4 domain-containing protein, partial [Rhizobium johnstonii]
MKVGDEVRVRNAGFERTFIVQGILVKRVGAELAAKAARETTPPPPPRESMAIAPVRERGAGRPTKRERRDME